MAHYAIVALGESNSGGPVLNTEATSAELLPRPGIKMLRVDKTLANPVSQYFESLQIGVNNNLSHNALNSSTHGWERQLANDQASGVWPAGDTIYYIQTGQGGSRAAEWANPGIGYWGAAVARFNLAKAYYTANGISPVWIVWLSLGINDAVAGTDTTTWKTQMLDLINRIKTELPGVKIVLTELPSRPTFNAKIRELANSESNVTFCGITGCALQDSNHWSYAGFNVLSTRMSHLSQIMLGIRQGQIFADFTSNCEPQGAGLGWVAGSAGGATTKTAVPFGDGNWIAFETNAAAQNIIAYLQVTRDTSHTYPPASPYLQGVFLDSGFIARIASNGDVTANISQYNVNGKVRYFRSSNDLLIQKAPAGSDTWTTVATVAGVLAAVTTVHINIVNLVVAGTDTFVVTTPAGALDIGATTTFLVGNSYPIRWGTSRYGANVDLLLSLDGGSTFPITIASNMANDGDYSYSPVNAELSATAVFKLQDHNSPAINEVSAAVIVATVTAGGGGSGSTNSDLWQLLQTVALNAGIDLVEV